MKKQELVQYGKLLSDIKQRVRQGQQRAAMSANATMILTYWDIGQMIAQRQEAEGWGASVIPRLAVDLKNELPEEKGFSQRNLGNMVRFFREYGVPTILQHAAAKLASPGNSTEKCKDVFVRLWYAEQTIQHGWNRDVLNSKIKSSAHALEGAAVTNFSNRLPAVQAELSQDLAEDGS